MQSTRTHAFAFGNHIVTHTQTNQQDRCVHVCTPNAVSNTQQEHQLRCTCRLVFARVHRTFTRSYTERKKKRHRALTYIMPACEWTAPRLDGVLCGVVVTKTEPNRTVMMSAQQNGAHERKHKRIVGMHR